MRMLIQARGERSAFISSRRGMMRKSMVVLLAAVLVAAFAVPAMAEISFFGTARVLPTYYSNFDFNDNLPDAPTLNEGGLTMGEHIRNEIRLGWKAGGDKHTSELQSPDH